MNKKTTIGSKRTGFRKAVTTIRYALLIAFLVGAFLFIQNYIKRATQGRLQAGADQLSDQYAMGLTNGHDHNSSSNFYFEIRTAGLNNPTRITISSGSAQSQILRNLRPLQETWP